MKKLLKFLAAMLLSLYQAQAKPLIAEEASNHLVIEDGFELVDLVGLFDFLEDSEHSFDFQNIRNQGSSFQSSKGHSLNWGIRNHPVWLRLKIEDRRRDKTPLILELDYSQIDKVKFSHCSQDSQIFANWSCSQFDLAKTIEHGGRESFERRRQRAATHDEFQIRPLNSQGSEFHTIWIQAQTSGSLQLTAKLRSQENHIRHHREMILINGIYFGGLVVLIAYNLFICISLRSSKYLGYVAYMASWLVFQFFLSGFGFTYFGHIVPELIGTKIVPIGILLFGHFALTFALLFLDFKPTNPNLYRFCVFYITTGLCFVLLSPLFSYDVFLRITMLGFTPIWIVLEFTCGFVALKTRRRTAILYLVSWSALVLGSLIVMLRTIGILPINVLTIYAQQMGSWLEGLLMSFAMADVINQLRKKTAIQAQELKRANEELRHHDQLKDEFLANTSHELRTPIHGILGITESILENHNDQLPPDVQRKLRLVVGSSKRLGNLVRDLLDYSKLNHGDVSLNLRAISLRENVQIVMEILSSVSQNSDVQMLNKVDSNLDMVYADEDRLQQILLNLLGNAQKFTSKGEISVYAEKTDQKIRVFVSDTGIGIAPEKTEIIFQSFVQGDGSTSREYGGAGLGLAIAKKLIELHQGQISVTSQVGKGSTFSFELAVATQAQTDQPQARTTETKSVFQAKELSKSPVLVENDVKVPSPKNGAQKGNQRHRSFRILVADDDPMNLEVIRAHLDGENFELVLAVDGQEALDLVESKGPFDLVLCDVMMPRKTGYDFCRILRRKKSMAELPVILLTAKGQLSDLVMGFDSGANDYLIKPFAKKELLARMQAHLRVSETNAALGRFVPRAFLKLLGHEQITDVKLGDARSQQLAVLFADIRDFTRIAENLNPEQTFSFVNTCLARIGPHISQNNGFVDKYIGDAIMALFPHTIVDALRAAIGIQVEVDRLNEFSEHNFASRLKVGSGLHCGHTILGTIGEPERFDVTVISDSVNVASRIEGVTKQLGVRCLVSQNIIQELPADHRFTFRRVGCIVLTGKAEGLNLFELLDALPELEKRDRLQNLEKFEQAIEYFSDALLDRAAEIFKEVCSIDPNDSVAAYYLEVCEEFKVKGLPAHFDGSLSIHKAA